MCIGIAMTTTNGYQDVSFTTDENSDFQSNKTQLTRGVNTGTITYLQEAVGRTFHFLARYSLNHC